MQYLTNYFCTKTCLLALIGMDRNAISKVDDNINRSTDGVPCVWDNFSCKVLINQLHMITTSDRTIEMADNKLVRFVHKLLGRFTVT